MTAHGVAPARSCAPPWRAPTRASRAWSTASPRRAIGARDVLVAVRCAGVNHIDVNALRDGYAVDVYAGARGRRAAWTPGREFSGVVVAVGDGARGWRVGDECYGATAPTTRAARGPSTRARPRTRWRENRAR